VTAPTIRRRVNLRPQTGTPELLFGSTEPFGAFAVSAGRFVAGFPASLEIASVRTADSHGVVDAIAEAVRQDGVVHVSAAAFSLGDREVLRGAKMPSAGLTARSNGLWNLGARSGIVA
jgi:hypothetical protein